MPHLRYTPVLVAGYYEGLPAPIGLRGAVATDDKS